MLAIEVRLLQPVVPVIFTHVETICTCKCVNRNGPHLPTTETNVVIIKVEKSIGILIKKAEGLVARFV